MKKIQNRVKIGWYYTMGILVGMMLLMVTARLVWHGKFFPGVKIANVEVGGLRREEAKPKLEGAIGEYQAEFSFNGSKWEAPSGSVSYLVEESMNEAYAFGRRLEIADYLMLLINRPGSFPLILAEGKTSEMENLISQISEAVEIVPVDSEIVGLGKNTKVINGSDGVLIDGDKLDKNMRNNYRWLTNEPIEIPMIVVSRELGDEELEALRMRAVGLGGKYIELRMDDTKIKVEGAKLIALLATDGIQVVDESVSREYVQGWRESLDSAPQNAKFEYADGRVIQFAPGKDGVEVQVEPTVARLIEGIKELIESEAKNLAVEVEVERTPPQVTTDKVNELGIEERIGRGESYYAHSIANRIYNVSLSSSRINSTLIAPGEEFSFNKAVGDISGSNGYREAYVISAGRTVLGDGGGVCQVSTTVFRAALLAGLPITERWAHAYRVGYYEQNSKAGVDATIYAPSKDLRFVNDTPGHILIQTINDPKKQHLVVEIYGTNDGRVAKISDPKVWGVTPPLPDIYQDDPSLPVGEVKQVDWSAWGAKASFEYKVVRGEEVLQERIFSSSYRPWANVYLRGIRE